MNLYSSTLTESKVSETARLRTNPVETLISLIERSSRADLPVVLQAAVQFLQISQTLQPHVERFELQPYAASVERIESVIGEPLPVSWEPLIRSRTFEDIDLSIKAVKQYQRTKRIWDIKRVMHTALKECWKPNLNF